MVERAMNLVKDDIAVVDIPVLEIVDYENV